MPLVLSPNPCLLSNPGVNPRPPMFSDRSTQVREKKFPLANRIDVKRGQHSSSTLTDDHTLFLLNQQREKSSKFEKRNWVARIFRRR